MCIMMSISVTLSGTPSIQERNPFYLNLLFYLLIHLTWSTNNRFRQILYNLLSNAIKFTPEHGNIDLSVTNTADEPDHIQVKVRDTGIGIKQQGHRSIFKVYSCSPLSSMRRVD